MFNFNFYNPTRIHFGKGTISALSQEIPDHACILLLYGGGSIIRTGILEEVKEALDKYQIIEFGGIEPNPTFETLSRAVEIAKTSKVNFILAVGGGSVIDGAKYVAAATCLDGDGWRILETRGEIINRALPIGVVLTLAGTGSEMNSGGVVTKASTHDKIIFKSVHCYPRFAILDPEKTMTLPLHQVANGVVDAYTHIMEQYLTYPVDAKVQDRFAESLLQTLIEEGPKALAEPQNYDVRANLMWTASLALNGLIGAGVPHDWATHMIGHEITALHGLDHAQTLAIVLPAMLTVRKIDKEDKLLQYAERVWNLNIGTREEKIDMAICKTRDFFEIMQVKTRLREYGVGADSFPALLAQLERHGLVALGERKNVNLSVSFQVLELCL